MKKIGIRKHLRLALVLICVAFIVVLAIAIYLQYKDPGVEEKKVPLYSYESEEKINYEVFLKPNSLYEQKSLGEDQVYLTNLVDYVDTVYTYEFNGEREAEIKGSYEIVAVVEGYAGEGDKLTTLWQKKFPLVAETNFEVRDKKFSITKKTPLKIIDYNTFVEKIKDETSVSTQVKVKSYMNVELIAETDKGVIEKKASPSLEIPLNTGYFKISKIQAEGKPEAIEDVQSVPMPLNNNLLMGYSIAIGILLIALLALIFGTRKVEIDPFVKEIKKIFKKHGTRFVALKSEVAATSEEQSQVRSIEDLVRISDELGKPIIYKYSDNIKEIFRFWVVDGQRYYIFDVKELIVTNLSLKEKVRISTFRKSINQVSIDSGENTPRSKDIEDSMKETAATNLSDHETSKEIEESTVVNWQKS